MSCQNNNCCEIKHAPDYPMYSFKFTNVSDEEDILLAIILGSSIY